MKPAVDFFTDILLKPHPLVIDPEARERSKLLSALTLVLIGLFAFIIVLVIQTDPNDIQVLGIPLGLLFFWGVMYVSNRSGKTRTAAAGVLLSLTLTLIYVIYFTEPVYAFIYLPLLLLPVILTALFFPFNWTFIFSISLLTILFVMNEQQHIQELDPTPYWKLRTLWYILVLGVGMILTFIGHNQSVETIRQNTLMQLNKYLAENEARIRSLVENSPDTIFEINHQGKIVFINRFADTYLGKNIRDFLPENQLGLALDVIEAAFSSGEPQKVELQTIAPDGQISWDSVRAGPVKQNDYVTSLTVIMTEITEQKEATNIVRESEARYRTLVETFPDIILLSNLDGKVLFINPALEHQTGYTLEDLNSRGKPIIHPDDVGIVSQAIQELLASDKVCTDLIENRLIDKNGSIHWYNGIIAKVQYEGEVMLQTVTREITSSKLAEQEREVLINDLEAKNAELESFTYTVSHDLKSPLVTINGYLGFIEQDAASGNMERLKKDTLRIQEATKKMHALLNELLELSRVGRLMNASEDVPLEDIIKDAINNVHGRIEQRNITIITQPNLPIVHGDRQRLTQVVQNLLDNAAKNMGDQLTPQIEIGQQGEDGGNPIFFVRDNGIGIAPEYHERIFGLFNKLDVKSEGTGVGLALVKRIIEYHGGKIRVKSEGVGKGSTFCFTLPELKTTKPKQSFTKNLFTMPNKLED